jgi:hypothetical protein
MWISKKRYYKAVARASVREIRYMVREQYQDPFNKLPFITGSLLYTMGTTLYKEMARKRLPPNVTIGPSKRFEEMGS